MKEIVEFNAYLGSIFLAICAVPMAWKSHKEGHSKGVDEIFLALWGIGEFLVLTYVTYNLDIPLILNYGLNLIFISIVVYYKIKPRSIDE